MAIEEEQIEQNNDAQFSDGESDLLRKLNKELNEEENDDWTLETLEHTEYLQDRKAYFADNVYKIGAGIAAVLVVIALFAMN